MFLELNVQLLKRHGFMLSTIYLEGDFCCLEVLFRGIDITVNDNVNDITHKEGRDCAETAVAEQWIQQRQDRRGSQ